MKFATILLTAALLLCTAAMTQAATTPADGFAATFVETRTLPGFDTPIVSHGNVRFSREHGFRWEITKPYHYVFAMGDGRAEEVLPNGKTRQLDPEETPWLKAVEHIFVGALSGNQSELESYFHLHVEPLQKGQGRHVTLTPKSGAMAKVIEKIEVTESAPGHPQKLVIKEASGGTMVIRFKPIQPSTQQ